MINRQLVIRAFDRSIDIAVQVHERQLASPLKGEVVVRTAYVGINALYDRELYRGAVPYIDVEFPYVYGVESVGYIYDVGSDVAGLAVGDAVSIVKVGSAYQEYQTVPQQFAVKVPAATPEYLAINPTGISAKLAVEKAGEVQSGETVLVTAAAGGLGHFLVQLCKAKGCHVIATCGQDSKVDLLEDLNCCDRIVQYNREHLSDVLQLEYANKIDVAFDSVGGQIFDTILPHLAPLGRIVVCGLASELSRTSFEIVRGPRAYESIYWKGASIRCFMNHLFRKDHPEARARLTEMYQKGILQVVIDPTVFNGIDSIVPASKYLLAGNSRGKVVVRIS